jgi:predicted dienelactone hydrolase
MKFTTDRASTTSALAQAVGISSRSRLLVALVAAPLALALFAQLPGHAAAATGGLTAHLRVGHTVKRIIVGGSAQDEPRAVDVHLWYPADPRGFDVRPKAFYRSALYGQELPSPWKPLSWQVQAEVARQNAPIDPGGPTLPVIVFSHGSTNDPIDYAHTLELIAAAGFVVAAPTHVNNTQDDVRIDFINSVIAPQIPCNDGLPSPCSRTNVARSMADRVRDISSVLNSLPGWFGNRVDVSRAGVLGHSRGTVTALAAAGGTAEWSCGPTATPSCPSPLNCVQPRPPEDHPPCWPGVQPDTRVRAIMGMAIGGRPITFGANLGHVHVPTVLVAGGKDQNSTPDISQDAFRAIPTNEKALISIPNAVHRSFDSTYCDQAQAAGATADADGNGRVDDAEAALASDPMTPARLDRHTLIGILTSPLSGNAVQYCSPETFTSPIDIRPLVKALSGFDVACVNLDQATGRYLKYNVPTTGLDTDEVKRGMTALAVTFFGTVLRRRG